MIKTNEDAVICDFAETYNIYDYRRLPAKMAAVLACGFRDNSRIKLIMARQNISVDTLLRAMIVDRLSLLLWAKTVDGQNNKRRPPSIAEALQGTSKKAAEEDVKVFSSVEELENTLKEIRERNNK